MCPGQGIQGNQPEHKFKTHHSVTRLGIKGRRTEPVNDNLTTHQQCDPGKGYMGD